MIGRMGFDRNTLPPDREQPERSPWTSWVVLAAIVIIIVVGLIYFL
jgi:hypothetical protein